MPRLRFATSPRTRTWLQRCWAQPVQSYAAMGQSTKDMNLSCNAYCRFVGQQSFDAALQARDVEQRFFKVARHKNQGTLCCRHEVLCTFLVKVRLPSTFADVVLWFDNTKTHLTLPVIGRIAREMKACLRNLAHPDMTFEMSGMTMPFVT